MLLSELRASAWKYAALAGAVLAVAALLACWFFWHRSVATAVRADAAEQRAEAVSGQLRAVNAARAAERQMAQDMAAIALQYEQDKRSADEAHRKLVGDLRAGNERLHDRWAGCVSDAGRTAAELDAAKREREESAARAIAAADQCDAQVRGLQELVRKDRENTR